MIDGSKEATRCVARGETRRTDPLWEGPPAAGSDTELA